MVEGLMMTPEQRQAVESLDQDCIVSAGAGSGKTRVLVERFLHILERELETESPLDAVVAITFTEKAATEMKNRIRKGITQRMETARKEGRTRDAEGWYRILSDAARARITTIHSFCAGLLRDFPVEADVDPQFTVLDDIESRMLLRETVEEVLPTWFEGVSDTKAGDFLSPMEQLITVWGVRGTVFRLMNAYRQMAGNGWSPEETARLTQDGFSDAVSRMAAEQSEGKFQVLQLGAELLNLRGGKRVTAFQEAWPSLAAELSDSDEPEKLIPPLERAEKLLSGHWGRKEEIVNPRDRMKAALQKLLQAVEGRVLLDDEETTVEGLLQGLRNIHEAYIRKKRERAALDFDELQFRAVQLLENHPDVRRRLNRHIRYLMVDEYQDTNEAQKRLIDQLCIGPGGGRVPGRLFVVGDPKQSIYRFRGADVSVFGKTRAEIRSEGGREVDLIDNFRSDAGLVAFVNALFPNLMTGAPDEPNHYRKVRANRDFGESPRVEFMPLPDPEEKSSGTDLREMEAEWIARRIGELIDEGVPAAGIAVLFQAMTHVKQYEQALIRRDIPFRVVKGRGFYHRQEVLDVIHFMRSLSDPDHTLALAGVLRSPFCGISDDTLFRLTRVKGWSRDKESWLRQEGLPDGERWKLESFLNTFHRLVRLTGRIPVSDLLERLLEETGYRHALWAIPGARQAQANLDKFLRISRTWQGAASFSLDAALRSIDRLLQEEMDETEAPVEGDEEDSVQLMTVHQSKGLEFPVVFVPDLSRQPVEDISDLSIDCQSGLVTCLAGRDGEKWETYRWREVKEREKRLAREESARLFYVAVTRAEDRLILSGRPQEHKGLEKGEPILSAATWSRWMDGVLGYRRIDWDRRIWSFKRGGPTLTVQRWEGEKKASSGSDQTGLDIWLDDPSPFAETVPVPEDLSEPRGWRSEDRQEMGVTDLVRLANCPRQYYYDRILNLPSLDQPFSVEEGELHLAEEIAESRDQKREGFLSPRTKGDIVHRLTEITPDSRPSEEEMGILLQQVMDEWRISASDRPRAIAEIRPLWESFLNSDIYLLTSEQAGIRKEARFVQRMDGIEVAGIIDRLHCTWSGEWELIDYKTNDVDPADLEQVAEEYLPQLQLYVAAAQEEWGVDVDRAVLFFLKPNRKKVFWITDRWKQEAKRAIDRSIRLLRQGTSLKDFVPRPGKRCGYCGFQSICKEAFKG
ncbi:UvrD-helicase domain-containing protein [Paludifilum halophilum]|uniref:DNA 3'-5' helicase n=1 Tax=Paludifilum halophilum TaxID=1642702 RepID=A0A235B990_9BACL|nr:UvrD-helicase domain-containing protein [Paludifilum halophilum]OYD08873.1 hypothetical protein CHM34_03560 [Paludifilum halophilum]